MPDEFDLTQAIQKVQQMLSSEDGEAQIQNLLGMFQSANPSSSPDAEEAEKSRASIEQPDMFSGLSDIETILKLKNVMSVLSSQKSDANAAFLNSLKPFVKKERRQKLEQAAKLMSVAKAIKVFKDMDLGGV